NDYAAQLGVIYHPYTGTDVPPNISVTGLVNTMGSAQTAPAHSIFIITLGELGWVGFILFFGMLISWLYMAAVFMRRRNEHLVSRYGLAAFFSIFAMMLQGLTEWAFRFTPI